MSNLGFDHTHYVPVLKWKKGEYSALQELGAAQQGGMTPLLEIPCIPESFDENTPQKTLAQHLSQIPDQLAAILGRRRGFIDAGSIGEELVEDVHPLEWLLSQTKESNPGLIPVTSPNRSALYDAAIKGSPSGACIRLGINEFGDEDIAARLSVFRQTLTMEPPQIDIVFDLQAVDPAQIRPLRAILKRAINEFPDRDSWRSMTVIGTGFPVDLSDVSKGMDEIPRVEFSLWNDLVSTKPPARIPTFGDYTASHCESVEGDPRLLSPSANIRYTLSGSWLVAKGGPVRGQYAKKYDGYNQFFTLSARLMERPEFMGEDFSWGDGYIARCARRLVSTGSMTTWRQVAVNHHVTFVQRQVSTWISPEVGP